jgi:sugar lactone lactonase YvrE
MRRDDKTMGALRVQGIGFKVGGFSVLATAIFTLLVASASAAPPLIISTSFSHVTTSSAMLEAEVNPEGKKISYRFEYGSADCETNPCISNPELEGLESSHATSPQSISVTLKGLSSDSIYHFRIVVANGKESASGADAVFSTFVQHPLLEPCPNNSVFRSEKPSMFLPDCRAYEQSSPINKNGADVNGSPNEVQASTEGNAVSFFTAIGLPGAAGAQDFETFLARRGESNWATHGVYPQASDGPVALNAGWTPDLSFYFSNVANSFNGPWLFQARTSATETFASISSGSDTKPSLAGASADGSIVYFQSESPLTNNAIPGKDNLYVWDRNTHTVSLAGILPDSACGVPPCVPTTGSFAGAYEWFVTGGKGFVSRSGDEYYVQPTHAISSDGKRAYFTAEGGQLYLREDAAGPTPSTARISAPQRIEPDTNGTRPAAFMAATPDGSKAFFTSPEKLTENATTGPEPPTGAIGRADIEGKPESIDLNCLPARAASLAMDSQFIYWANPGTGTIGRAELGCKGDVDNAFIITGDEPQWIAVDSGHIYWTSSLASKGGGEGEIGRADIEGKPESIEAAFIPGRIETAPGEFEALVGRPQGIAVDTGHIYWANDRTNAIARADIEGKLESVEPSWHDLGPSETPQGVAVDATHIYWTSNNPNSWIAMADLSGEKEVFKSVNLEGFVPAEVRGLAIHGNHVYWVRKAGGDIGRSNLELGAIEEGFLAPSGGALKGLAVDTEDIYWTINGEAVPNPGNDLYQFDVKTGKLTDLAPDIKDMNGAEVKGILGTSEDGSYVYFAANGDLDGEGLAETGNCEAGTLGEEEFLIASGRCNLYLAHGGVIKFIAPLDAGGGISDAANWEPQGQGSTRSAVENTARVSADGKTLLFRSQERLTSFHQGDAGFYRYDADSGVIDCVSCSPSGEASAGTPSLQSLRPSLPVVEPPGAIGILTRNLSADGNRIFFETPDKLVAEDVNGDESCLRAGQASVPSCQDVYEWEAEGTGSCKSKVEDGGCLYLLSSGTSTEPTFFADASESGKDVFIFTREALVHQDQDELQDVYDARVDGGLDAQNAMPALPCEGTDACHGPVPMLPPSESPQTPRFQGPGNQKGKIKTGCPKGKRKVKKKGKSRCVSGKNKQKRTAKERGANDKGRVGK